MKAYCLYLFTLSVLFFLYGCNPDCTTLNILNAGIDSNFKTPGSEVLITAQPPSTLELRTVFAQPTGAAADQGLPLESRFVDKLGIIATLPADLMGDYDLYVEDPDCGGRLYLSNLSVVAPSFFFKNPNFVTPIPPQIIVPNLPVIPPVDVVNAWFSPDDQEYCIWFTPDSIMTTDSQGRTLKVESTRLVKGDFAAFPSQLSSLELSAGCNDLKDDDLFHGHSVSGIIDKHNNVINIQIDRSLIGLGIERFTGQFINKEDLPERYHKGSPCGDNDVSQTDYMLLTSQTTGKQLVMFRNM